MEIYKELKSPASQEFEKLLNSQFSKNKNLVEGKIIEGIVTTIDLHKKILSHKKFINSDFDTNWLAKENFS